MTKRPVPAVFFLPIITGGIYAVYWYVVTKDEMNRYGAGIPTAWLLLVPFANVYWLWKWCCGLGMVTQGNRRNTRIPAPIGLLLHVVFPLFNLGIFQMAMNEAADRLQHGPLAPMP